MGCEGRAAPPFDERHPDVFRVPLDRCPMWYVACRPDSWRDEVVKVWHDYQAGVCHGWPHLYSGQTVAAVRYLQAAHAEALDLLSGG